MASDKDRITTMLKSLAGAVIGAIRSGSAAERTNLVHSLNEMEKNTPNMTEDTAEAKVFLLALISLLEGKPVSADGLAEPYAGIYIRIVSEALKTERKGSQAGPENEMRDYLTQLAATVVLMMRKGTEEEKKGLGDKLRETANGIQAGNRDAGEFVLALASILEGRPVESSTLKAPYSGFYTKVLGSIASNSR